MMSSGRTSPHAELTADYLAAKGAPVAVWKTTTD
jgi:hypothetical protein